MFANIKSCQTSSPSSSHAIVERGVLIDHRPDDADQVEARVTGALERGSQLVGAAWASTPRLGRTLGRR